MRFEEFVEKIPESVRSYFVGHVTVSKFCWTWAGSVTPSGYGLAFSKGRPKRAHRLAFEWARGEIPAGHVIDHLCRVRLCVNPAHMDAVSERENILRGSAPTAINARKTRCSRGHPLSPSHRRGWRICVECKRSRAVGYYHARSQEHRYRHCTFCGKVGPRTRRGDGWAHKYCLPDQAAWARNRRPDERASRRRAREDGR